MVVTIPVKVLLPLRDEYDASAVFRRAIVSYPVNAVEISVFVEVVVE